MKTVKKKSFTKVLFVKKLKKHDPTLLGIGCMYVFGTQQK